jgi:hypothetical protein
MDTQYTVNLNYEMVDHIVSSELTNVYHDLQKSLTNRMDDYERYGIFSKDKDEDIIAINEHLYALSLILKYYGVDINEN